MNNTAEIGGDFCTMGIKWGWGILYYGIQGLPYKYDV